MPALTPPTLSGPWTTEQVDAFLAEMFIPMRLAVVTPSGWPLVLSLWFLADGGELLAATRPTAVLVRALEADPRCGFEIAGDMPPYRGVRGRADVVLDGAAGAATLDRLLVRYLGSTESPLAQRLRADADDELCLRLRPRTIVSWDFSDRMASSLTPAPKG